MTNPIRRSLCAGVVAIIVALTPFYLDASPGRKGAKTRPHKFDDVLKKKAGDYPGETVPVIVKVNRADRNAVRKLLKTFGHRVKRDHSGISAFSVRVPVEALDVIAAFPGVLSVSFDAPLQGEQLTVTTPPTSGVMLRDTLGLANTTLKGRGVGVAIIDSGIAPLADFGTRIVAFYDFTKGGIATAPYDDHGHGTHIAGIIGGSGVLSNGVYAGLAPRVSLIGLKALNANGGGDTSDVIAALEFATANKKALGIDIINLSMGHAPFEPAALDPLVQAVEQASAAGILVVSSAGNKGINPATGLPGFGGISSPGNAPSAFTIGAARTAGTKRRSDDTVGAFSSRGPTWYDGFSKPDVIAPGHKLVGPAAPGSTLVKNNPALLVGGLWGGPKYITLTGTSMAAAVVSGLAALVIEANETAFPTLVDRPALTPNAIKAIVEFTAFDMRDEQHVPYMRLIQGAGAINGSGALKLAKAIDTGVPEGAYWLHAPIETSDVIVERLPWAQNIMWGDNVIWGDMVFKNVPAWTQNIVWGENVVWGENLIWGENLVWGENVIWGENVVWGENVIWGENLIWGESILVSND